MRRSSDNVVVSRKAAVAVIKIYSTTSYNYRTFTLSCAGAVTQAQAFEQHSPVPSSFFALSPLRTASTSDAFAPLRAHIVHIPPNRLLPLKRHIHAAITAEQREISMH